MKADDHRFRDRAGENPHPRDGDRAGDEQPVPQGHLPTVPSGTRLGCFGWFLIIAGITFIVLIVVAVIRGPGVQPSEPSKTTAPMPLGQAFCNDLKAGATPYQILQSSLLDGSYTPQEAVDNTEMWVGTYCPEEYENEWVQSFLSEYAG